MRNFENKQKIRQVSKGLNIISFTVMMIYGIGLLVTLPMLIYQMNIPVANLRHFFYSIPDAPIEIMVWCNFWIFFGRLKDGHIFDATTVSRLLNAGTWKFVSWIYLLIVSLMFDPPRGLDGWLIQLGGVTGPLAIILVAWLLREGQTLEEEQKLTV